MQIKREFIKVTQEGLPTEERQWRMFWKQDEQYQLFVNLRVHRQRRVPRIDGQTMTSVEPCSHAAMQPCSHAAMQPCSHAAMQPCSHAAMQPCSHAAMQPCNHAAMQPCSHATMQPCNHATMQPCNHATSRPADEWQRWVSLWRVEVSVCRCAPSMMSETRWGRALWLEREQDRQIRDTCSF